MDCTNAQHLLAFDRPWASELDAVEAEALRAHLAACPTCAAQAERERLTEERLAQAMRDVPIPEGLHGRLLDRLTADRRLVFRRRCWQAAAAAAVVLAAIGVGWYVRLALRPAVDPYEIARQFDMRPYDSPEQVQEWFRKHHGVAMVAPGQFNNSELNYRLLKWYDMARFQEREVPALCFVAPGPSPACAMIFVLSDDAFNFANADVGRPAPGSFYRVQLVRPPDNPHILFVILYTSDTLAPFLTAMPAGA